MSYVKPDICDGYETCQKYDCEETGGCLTVHLTDGPSGKSHTVTTDYTVTVAGVIIPIIKTDRKFKVTCAKRFGDPGAPDSMFINGNGDFQALVCSEYPPDVPTCEVTEDCTIERSILHYVDQRYGVCLYQYIKDELKFNVISHEEANFKGTWGIMTMHQVKIKTTDVACTRTEEWRLIIGGVESVLTTRTVDNMPFDGITGSGYKPFSSKFVYDSKVVQVLVFPQPPSMAIPWSDDIRAYGFYDYGNLPGEESELNKLDGGEKDMFYPQWCRNLFTDPFWREAADRRYQISWFHSDLRTPAPNYTPVSYTPPSVYTNPIPRGTYVEHPVVGKVYQFLVNEAYGAHVETSPDFDALVSSQLALAKNEKGELKGLTMNGTSLYYPIGVI